jgi:hypothetical protein
MWRFFPETYLPYSTSWQAFLKGGVRIAGLWPALLAQGQRLIPLPPPPYGYDGARSVLDGLKGQRKQGNTFRKQEANNIIDDYCNHY